MPTDLREQILERILAVTAGIDGVKHASRNTQDVPANDRPAVITHDGNEELDDRAGRPDYRGRLQLQIMTPQICVYFSTTTKNVGTVANAFRMRLLAAIFNNVALKALLFDEEIRYQGCTLIPPDVTEGRETRLEVELAFTYPFRVSDFTS